MISILQIVVVLFALFALSRAFLRFKDSKITKKELALWAIVWIAAIIVILIPGTTSIVAKMLGVTRGADVVVYFSIILLFYLVFRVYVKLESIEQEITKVVREVAIKKKKK